MNSIAPPCFEPIEYIQDRLYLASYDKPPPNRQSLLARTPKASRAYQGQSQTTPPKKPPVYFTVDDSLLYNAFHADFGPFHIGHLYRFAVHFHEILGDPANNNRIVVFWSKPDARSRANAACLVACYMVLIQSWPPHLALAPIAQADPPYMPFRDAGYSQADFVLGIQDVVYGVWRAKEEGLCGLKDFDLEEYELYERVDMGDFNWITPNFVAFASPQLQPIEPIPAGTPAYDRLPSSIAAVVASTLPLPLKNVLVHFKERNVGLVVRLNSQLYCPTYFSALGIQHLDMIFDDGTCPPLPLVRRFIHLAHETITQRGKSIAVHCKAGLGRTGCLIGAYLIYRHGFTANEVISFMRFMRPGMVVGPQQHWLHLNQGAFREWWYEDTLREKITAQLTAAAAATAAAATTTTPVTPARKQKLVILTPDAASARAPTPTAASPARRAALNEIDNNEATGPHARDDYLPAPTPGQPRKTHRRDSRNHPYARAVSGSLAPHSEELTASARRRKASASMAYLANVAGSPASSQGGSPCPEGDNAAVGTESPSPSPSPSPSNPRMHGHRRGGSGERVLARQRRIPEAVEERSGGESDEEKKLQMLARQQNKRRGGDSGGANGAAANAAQSGTASSTGGHEEGRNGRSTPAPSSTNTTTTTAPHTDAKTWSDSNRPPLSTAASTSTSTSTTAPSSTTTSAATNAKIRAPSPIVSQSPARSSRDNSSNVLGMSKVRRRVMHYHAYAHAHTHGHAFEDGKRNTARSDGKGVRKISGRVGSNGAAKEKEKEKEKEGGKERERERERDKGGERDKGVSVREVVGVGSPVKGAAATATTVPAVAAGGK